MRAKQVGSSRTTVGVQSGMYTVLEKGRKKKLFYPKECQLEKQTMKQTNFEVWDYKNSPIFEDETMWLYL